ncbi:MAG: autotransporter domain-containing protein [Candidatus Omnitrophica bacterium]|nr:autotransporter domain-containing protein [Candidatus Omnitrophota bacterium]
MRKFFPLVYTIVLLYASSIPGAADSPTYTYANAITQATSNAVDTTHWQAASADIITIPATPETGGGTHQLRYDGSNDLIVRNATRKSYFSDYYVDYTGYTIQGGGPRTNAAWVTAGNDFTKFYDKNGNSATNTDLINIVERGLGIDTTQPWKHDTIVEYAVETDNNHIMRPTKNPDIRTYNPGAYGDTPDFVKPDGMDADIYADFSDNTDPDDPGYYLWWLDYAITQKKFPFTQLGYTYFWGNGDYSNLSLADIEGATEFIIPGGTDVKIYALYATVSYIYTKNKNDAFSTDADAQYGNGFASFDVTGPCDTLWAGHRFQKNTRRSSSSPNEIIIENGATVSGGEGILVWSLNYEVTNNGSITGTTTAKMATLGTEDIAILFKGNETAYGGVAAPTGINKLTNNGTISSPGTAVQVSAGTTTIINNIGGTISGTTAAIDIDAGILNLTNRGIISGTVALAGGVTAALDIGSTSVSVDGGNISQLNIAANSSASYGQVVATGGTAVATTTTMKVTVGGYIPNNATLTAIDASGAGVGGTVPGTIISTSPIFRFSASDATGDLVLTASRAATYNSFAASANGANAGAVLTTIADGGAPSGDMLTVLNSLDSLTSSSAIAQALDTMTPNTDNSSPLVSQVTQDKFVSTTLAHLDGFKNVVSGKGKEPSHDPALPKDLDLWTGEFGDYLHQDEMAQSGGYNATVWGTILGCDLLALEHTRLGISGGFAQDFVRTKDFSSRTNVNSYQGSLYGSYAEGSYFIDTAFSFAYNTYDASRHVAAGSIDRTASGDYNGQQYSGYLGAGYTFKAKKLELTPLASFMYSHLRLNSYTEDGAGALNLNVSAQDFDIAQTGLGAKIGYPLELERAAVKVTPELKGKWLYDWVGDPQATTSSFTGGGASFGTAGFKPAQSSYDFGIKLTIETESYVTVSVSYDLELKEKFYGHYALINVRYRI